MRHLYFGLVANTRPWFTIKITIPTILLYNISAGKRTPYTPAYIESIFYQFLLTIFAKKN